MINICQNCKNNVMLINTAVCKKKKIHNCRIDKTQTKCKNYKNKYEKDGKEDGKKKDNNL